MVRQNIQEIAPSSRSSKSKQDQDKTQELIKNLFREMQDNHRSEINLLTERLNKMDHMNRQFDKKIQQLTREMRNQNGTLDKIIDT